MTSHFKIVVIGDEVQLAAETAAALEQAFAERLLAATVEVVPLEWQPADGFSAAAEQAEAGEDVEELPPGWAEALAETDILVTHFFPARRLVLAAAPRLRLLATLRHGEENLDRDAAEARGIEVVNNPGREAEAVSDFAVLMILDRLRRFVATADSLRNSSWAEAFALAGTGLNVSAATIGLIGFGYVGQRAAAKLAGFGCRILVHDPFVDDVDSGEVEIVSLTRLLARSDVVSLHVRLSEATRGLIGREQLALMRPDAQLVNTARAELVDEEALVEALAGSAIGGASLDVFWQEPLPPAHPLRRLPSVTLTPHVAGSTESAQLHSSELLAGRVVGAVERLMSHLQGA